MSNHSSGVYSLTTVEIRNTIFWQCQKLSGWFTADHLPSDPGCIVGSEPCHVVTAYHTHTSDCVAMVVSRGWRQAGPQRLCGGIMCRR